MTKREFIKGIPEKEYNYKYFLEHKEEIYKKRKEKKVLCKYCNKEYTYECIYLHKKTEKHKRNKELYNLKNQNLNQDQN